MRPPQSQLGPVAPETRKAVLTASPFAAKYDLAVDRESAFEKLSARASKAAEESAAATAQADRLKELSQDISTTRRYDTGPIAGSGTRYDPDSGKATARKGPSLTEALAKNVVKELTGTTGRRIVRGILGSLFKAR